MADEEQHYYRPYDSADESGADSDESSSNTWYSLGSDQHTRPSGSTDGHPNFRAFATQSQMLDAAGRNFSTLKDQITYGKDYLGKNTTYSFYDSVPELPEKPKPKSKESSELEKLPPLNTQKELPVTQTATNVVIIDSTFRDIQAYPQPTNFSIRLPRQYKNVTTVDITEIKLLTSFYYFRPTKGNTSITLHEKDRSTFTYEQKSVPAIITSFITTGSYDITGLRNELTIKLNYTPLFFDYINGINDFINVFRVTGDLFTNFNQPGDFFYNRTTQTWIANPSINTIVTKFWKDRYIYLSFYSYDQVYLAYYYPVLNEYIQDTDYANATLNLTAGIWSNPPTNTIYIDPTVTTIDDVISRILYLFTGINPPDPVVLAVIKANIPLLDKYRLEHTFRYSLINKYIVGVQIQSQNIYITTPSLNTSLVSLLNQQYNIYLNEIIRDNGLIPATYDTYVRNVTTSLGVLGDMYNYEQTQFLNYFAVPWSQYTLGYYANLNLPIQVRDGIGAIGIPSDNSESLSSGIVNYTSTVLAPLQVNPNYLWPSLTSTNISTIFMINLSTVKNPSSTLNTIYQYQNSNFNPRNRIVDSNNYFYSDLLTQSANVVCPISTSQYTVFKFISPVRQTLQIETLPRPSVYRLPTYNQSNFDSTINKYFNFDYSFSSNIPYTNSRVGYTQLYDNLPSNQLNQVPGWSYATAISTNINYSWGRSYTNSFNQYTSSIPLTIATSNRALYFQFTTPEVSTATILANSSFTYSFNLGVQFYSTLTSLTIHPINTDYHMFLYQDRAAFQADVLQNRNETPTLFKFSTLIGSNSTAANISFTTYPQQTYYTILRPDASNFANTFARVAPYFVPGFISTQQSLSVQGLSPNTDICGNTFNTLIQTNFNYAKVYDSNWIQLPVSPSTLWTPDPSSNAGNINVNLSNVPIGYDVNNVSNDYTDYIPYTLNSSTILFTPSSNIGVDPITQYIFQSNSPYNTTTQTFFYTNSDNFIQTPGGLDPYSPSTVLTRESKIAHYYSVNYLPESDSNFPITQYVQSNSNVQLPYTVSTTQNVPITGYDYGINSNIQLSRGVLGFNFIPQEGVWNLKRVMFRSAISDSNNDPNASIQYLGIYNMAAILSTNTATISLSTAITVLSNTSRVTYTPTSGGFDTVGGTYYEFQKDTGFVQSDRQYILGYTQTQSTMSDKPEDMYTIIGFNSFGGVQTMKGLSGSAIPYPFYNSISVATTYVDGTPAYNSTLYKVVVPSTIGQTNWPFATSLSSLFAPPTGTTQYQSQYALSMPIGTSVVNFKNSKTPQFDTQFVQPWTTTLNPTTVVGTVNSYFLLQDTEFNIYSYNPLQLNRSFDTPTWTFSEDDVYPSYENTSLVAVTGNSSNYYFLGFSNLYNAVFKLRLKMFNPQMGQLYDYPLQDVSFTVPLGGTVKSFTMNDLEQFVLCYQEPTNTTKFYYTRSASTFLSSYTFSQTSTAIHSMDPQTSTLYWLSLDPGTDSGNSITKWSLDSAPTISWITTGATKWNGISVTAASNLPASTDRIYTFTETNTFQSNVYYTSNLPPGGGSLDMTALGTVFQSTIGQTIQTISPGYKGGFWITTYNSPHIWGTRNTDPDIHGTVDAAWQIFYPFQKIVLEKIENTYNAITDLAYLNYPEYPHTQMFYYSNEAKFLADTTNKWGLESSNNFVVGNTTMNGYYFNSYMFAVPVIKSSLPQFLSIRGYTPTESSETMLRIVVPNKYDFGYPTQQDIINEISTYNTDINSRSSFTTRYAYTLSTFNIAFQQSNSYFGSGYVTGFDGSNINSSNYAQFASNVSTIYSGYLANASTVNGITTAVNIAIQSYISTTMKYIIPASASGRQNFTDPLTFSILFKSSLLPQYANLLYNWGLGYNLGYNKVDTPYSTYAKAQSFYKILQDYIYLRLNPEYKMNRIDTTAPENLSITRDSTGEIDGYFGKLLLNNFNQYSTTFLRNPITLNPPLGRLETIYFEWVEVNGTVIDNKDCNWTASMNVVENISKADLASKVPVLPWMS